jgi:hypothetical protein
MQHLGSVGPYMQLQEAIRLSERPVAPVAATKPSNTCPQVPTGCPEEAPEALDDGSC